MGRKRKVLNAEDGMKYLQLPPCRVCEGPAGGFHYGVNTCEACKGFFHRCSNSDEKLICKAGEVCPVLYTIPRICKKCRYAKCVAVGMAKQAIKTGRYTVEKKTRDILEIKRLQEQKARLEASGIKTTDTTLETDSIKSHKTFSERSQQDEKLDGFITSQRSDTNWLGTPVHRQESADSFGRFLYYNTCSSETMNEDCAEFFRQRISPSSQADYSPSTSVDRSFPSSPYSCVLFLKKNPRDTDRDYSKCNLLDSSGHSSDDTYSQCACLQNIYVLYSNTDMIVDALVQAREDHIKHLLPNKSKEEQHRIASEHIEMCKLRQEIFGGITRLPDKDYDSIYVNTGLDVDGRRKSSMNYITGMEICIRAYAKFAKCVPGFRYLRMEDKITLIKYSRNEFLCFMGFNSVSQGVIFCADKNQRCKVCAHIAGQREIAQMIDQFIVLYNAYRKLKLTLEEKVVSAAVALMAPDRENHVQSEEATLMYELLNDCLINLFKRRCSKPLQMYAKLTDLLVAFRTFSYDGLKYLGKLRFDKYTHVLDNPVLREMFGGIFFDDFEDSETDAYNNEFSS